MTVLILSEPNDFHAAAVNWGLEMLNVPADLWDRSQLANSSTLAINVSDDSCSLVVAGLHLKTQYKSVWNRRGLKPAPNRKVHPSDMYYAHREAVRAVEVAMLMLEEEFHGALWINSRSSQIRADLKPNQLAVARRAGFLIPETLYSNDPREVRNFASIGRVIAKSHFPAVWTDQSGTRRWFHTTRFHSESSSDFSLFACPMIYQKELDIDSELRVIVMGRSVFCVKRKRVARNDVPSEVRDIRVEDPISSIYALDERTKSACIAYVKLMNLNYAAIDLAICTDGRLLFLEGNESGQFLFLEHDVPSVPILDAFCRFLASGDPCFEYEAGDRRIRLDEFTRTSSCSELIDRLHKVWSGKFPASFEFDEVLHGSEAR
ncbi:hypothetical protein [Stenotrophomonas indicatrix]|uniref:hypothetical protein n=1 Tax=Stenotrophomonas indicatrix TaxID=2045451 RepID=UPI001CBB1262|nr:hypothetical protein [Stenotrophomonas indicatrix]